MFKVYSLLYMADYVSRKVWLLTWSEEHTLSV